MTSLTLILTLNDPHGAYSDPQNVNLIRQYGIEKCDIKHFSFGCIVFACIYRRHIHGKQTIRRDGVCIPTCLTMPFKFKTQDAKTCSSARFSIEYLKR